jgi:hypothetical protein
MILNYVLWIGVSMTDQTNDPTIEASFVNQEQPVKEYRRHFEALSKAAKTGDLKTIQKEWELRFKQSGKAFPELKSEKDQEAFLKAVEASLRVSHHHDRMKILGIENVKDHLFLNFYEVIRAPANAFKADSPQIDWLSAGYIRFQKTAEGKMSVIDTKSNTKVLTDRTTQESEAISLIKSLQKP